MDYLAKEKRIAEFLEVAMKHDVISPWHVSKAVLGNYDTFCDLPWCVEKHIEKLKEGIARLEKLKPRLEKWIEQEWTVSHNDEHEKYLKQFVQPEEYWITDPSCIDRSDLQFFSGE